MVPNELSRNNRVYRPWDTLGNPGHRVHRPDQYVVEVDGVSEENGTRGEFWLSEVLVGYLSNVVLKVLTKRYRGFGLLVMV